MARKREDQSHGLDWQQLAFEAVRWMRRPWFGRFLDPTPDRFMSLLLMNVYAYDRAGVPLSKKAAWKEMGAQEDKTGRKYIAAAEALGLIEIRQSTEDRRKELIMPTPRLKLVAEAELGEFANELPYVKSEPSRRGAERVSIKIRPFDSRVGGPNSEMTIFGGTLSDWKSLAHDLSKGRTLFEFGSIAPAQSTPKMPTRQSQKKTGKAKKRGRQVLPAAH